MLKIDMYAHILPRTRPDDMQVKFGVSGFPVAKHTQDAEHGEVCNIYRDGEFFRRVLPNCRDIEQRIAEYATHDIAVQGLDLAQTPGAFGFALTHPTGPW